MHQVFSNRQIRVSGYVAAGAFVVFLLLAGIASCFRGTESYEKFVLLAITWLIVVFVTATVFAGIAPDYDKEKPPNSADGFYDKREE